MDLFKFWYYEWAEHEWPAEDSVYFEGPLMRIHPSPEKFLEDKLNPGVASGYISVEEHSPIGTVTVRFQPERLIQDMRKHLSLNVLVDHLMAMEEAGWEL
tara:strand:- start:78 stop:377 length:300 start_codon:yes stop_codon:yes gene_type:complete